jgi:hypothetical protein
MMSRSANEREEKIVFFRKKKRKIATKKKKQKLKAKFVRKFWAWKNRCKSKDAAIFSIHLEPQRNPVQPVTEIPGSSKTLDVPRYIFPLMRPPYMKRVSPSLPDGPSFFFKKVRCGLNLE